jgi:hypothetical protein
MKTENRYPNHTITAHVTAVNWVVETIIHDINPIKTKRALNEGCGGTNENDQHDHGRDDHLTMPVSLQ